MNMFFCLSPINISITRGKSVPLSSTASVCRIKAHLSACCFGNASKNVLNPKIRSEVDLRLKLRALWNVTKSYLESPNTCFLNDLKSSDDLSNG